jgi:hypothetical protein
MQDVVSIKPIWSISAPMPSSLAFAASLSPTSHPRVPQCRS